MNSAYKGRNYFGAVSTYNEVQQNKERSNQIEPNRIYIAPGIYTFMEIPKARWTKQSIVSFK